MRAERGSVSARGDVRLRLFVCCYFNSFSGAECSAKTFLHYAMLPINTKKLKEVMIPLSKNKNHASRQHSGPAAALLC